MGGVGGGGMQPWTPWRQAGSAVPYPRDVVMWRGQDSAQIDLPNVTLWVFPTNGIDQPFSHVRQWVPGTTADYIAWLGIYQCVLIWQGIYPGYLFSLCCFLP